MKTVGKIVATAEVGAATAWMLGFEPAGAILVPWVWLVSLTCIISMSVSLMMGLHHTPGSRENMEGEKVIDPLRISMAVLISTVAIVKSHPAMAAVNLISLVVYSTFVKKTNEG